MEEGMKRRKKREKRDGGEDENSKQLHERRATGRVREVQEN